MKLWIGRKSHSIKVSSIVFAIILSINIIVCAELPKDIFSHWANGQIVDWINKGYIKGYPDGTFKPDDSIKRSEFIALVNRAYNFTKIDDISFSDVSQDAWYYSDIAKAVAAGYMNGYSDNTVKPNNNITRQEVAVIIARLKGLLPNESATNAFDVKEEISQWSKGYIGAVFVAGFMKGYPDGTFGAERFITRAEAVVASANTLVEGSVSSNPINVPIGVGSSGSSGSSVSSEATNGSSSTPTPQPTPTPTGQELSNVKVVLSTVGGSMVMTGAVDNLDITLVVNNLVKISAELGINYEDLKSGKKIISTKVNNVEHEFKYYPATANVSETLQAMFTGNGITETQANGYEIYLKK